MQAQNSHWEVGLNGSFTTPNNFNMMEYANWAAGLDVAWLHRSVGDEYWQRYRHYPTFGVRGSFLCIPGAVYGHRFGVVGLVRAPLLVDWMDYIIGFGISSYTRPYSLTHDPENIFISSVISCLIDIGLNFRIGERLVLNTSLLHSSNGMLMYPNKGLNFLQVGMAVKLGNDYERTLDWRHARVGLAAPSTDAPREWGLALSGGTVMSRDTLFGGYFPCYDLALYYQRYNSPVFAYGAAVDFWYNFVDKKMIAQYGGQYKLPLYLSAMAMAEWFWGPLSLKAGLGLVVAGSTQVTTPYYERVGVYYNFSNNYLGVALNAHGGRIEFIEWTFGHRFRGNR